MKRFEGIIQLPQEYLVAEDVLGETFNGSTEEATFKLTYPQLPPEQVADDQCRALRAPQSLKRFAKIPLPEESIDWGYTGFLRVPPGSHQRSLASWIQYVAIEITMEGSETDEDHNAASRFGEWFDIWYSRVLDWSELWTGIILLGDQKMPVKSRGHVRNASAPIKEAQTGWGATLAPVNIIRSTAALDRKTLASSFARASAQESPPTEWALYLQSQRAVDNRVSVINAATATEVALTRALHSRLRALPPAARKMITKQANGIAGLIGLIEKVDQGTLPSLEGRVKGQLAGLRNNAAHEGIMPDANEVANARATAKAVIERYTPLPQP